MSTVINLLNQTSYQRRVSPNDPMSVERVEVSHDPTEDVQWVLDPETKTLMTIPTEDITSDDTVITLPEYFDDNVTWLITSQIGLVNRHKAFLSIMNLGDCFLVALHKGALGLRSESEDEDDTVLFSVDYSGSATVEDCVWFTPDTFPTKLLKNPGHHGIFNVAVKINYYGDLDVSVGKWNSSIDTEMVLNPQFYFNLKAQRAAEEEAAKKDAAEKRAEHLRRIEMNNRMADASRARDLLARFAAQGTPVEG